LDTQKYRHTQYRKIRKKNETNDIKLTQNNTKEIQSNTSIQFKQKNMEIKCTAQNLTNIF